HSHSTVRTGPYAAVREVTLTHFDQGRETERFEVGIGKSHGERLAPGNMPGAAAAAGRVAQLPEDSECDECRSATPWSFPLAPKSGPQSQPDPASESNQFLGRFAEAKIAAPAAHIRGQLFHCRLDADALGSSRDISDSLLEPLQRFRRNRALDVRTGRKAEAEELPFLRSCHRTLCLIYLELELMCDEARDALHHPLTRAFTANIDVAIVRITYKRCPRRSSSRSSSSSTRLLSSGESGPPCGVPSTLGLTSPFSITPAFRNARRSFSSRLSSMRLAIWPISLS